MNIATEVPAVNYHLWKPCTMRCDFCFATFQDIAHSFCPMAISAGTIASRWWRLLPKPVSEKSTSRAESN